ncbi:unnamed protein product [Calicophoron daubneyi]|uniref:Uncharacterized protein n=1 Tax=Calicophoron daubneyi TaxID=300641 RepID=A0AAV2T6R6_CALDB
MLNTVRLVAAVSVMGCTQLSLLEVQEGLRSFARPYIRLNLEHGLRTRFPLTETERNEDERVQLRGISQLDNFLVAGISALMTNLIKLVLGAAFMTYCLAYVIFTFYHCDGKHCVGSPYIWGSCQDSWSEGDCREGYKKVHLSPLAEEKFLLNYVMARTESASSPYGFPVWFSVPSLIIAPYFAVWLLLLVITFTGYKTFGMALYVLSPAAFSLLLSVVVTVGIKYANAENQLNDFASRFYTRFATHIPVDQSAWDKFQIQPLVWGCLATFVHLSQSFNLWTGVFPLIGKWGGGQRIRRHVSWIPILVGWTVMGQLPTLLMMFSAASSYDPVNLRCHLAADWQAPFVVVPHMFSKFSSRRALSAAFFLGFFCFLLLAQGLLLLTTVVNVMECICPYFDLQFSVSPKKYRLCLFLVVPCLLIIGLPLISRSGFYWIRLVDWYADRLLIFTMALQAAGFLMSYSKYRSQ